MHRGVYLTTPGRDDLELRAVAALLAVGGPSALWGPSAGWAWGLAAAPEGDVSVVVPLGRSGANRPGISVVRSRHFADRVHPTEWPHRITAEHTVFDLALGHGPDRAIALMAKACQSRITSEERLRQALVTRPTQPHRALITEALGMVGAGAESVAEVRYVRDVELAHGLPEGRRQEPAPGSRSRDSHYESVGVVVEIDGRLGHEGWAGRQSDVRRDRTAAVGGLMTVRGSWLDVAVTPCEFADDLSRIFRSRGWLGSPQPCGLPTCALEDRAA